MTCEPNAVPMVRSNNQYICDKHILIGCTVYDYIHTCVLMVNDSDRFVAKITDSQTRTPIKHMQNTIRVGKLTINTNTKAKLPSEPSPPLQHSLDI